MCAYKNLQWSKQLPIYCAGSTYVHTCVCVCVCVCVCARACVCVCVRVRAPPVTSIPLFIMAQWHIRHQAPYMQGRCTATVQRIFLYIFSQQIQLIIYFRFVRTISVYSSTKCHVFHNVTILVHKIFTIYINCGLQFKCPAPGPKGQTVSKHQHSRAQITAAVSSQDTGIRNTEHWTQNTAQQDSDKGSTNTHLNSCNSPSVAITMSWLTFRHRASSI